jgi:phosphoenolpyruvate---glycerone phosphotransferase subunit DhaK
MLHADPMVEKMMHKLLPDLLFTGGDEVCLLINDLGATTMMELWIVNRKVHRILREMGIRVHETLIGSYCTCQEMAGFSISLMKLDDEFRRYVDMPANSIGFRKV